MRSEVVTTLNIMIIVLWDMTERGSVDVHTAWKECVSFLYCEDRDSTVLTKKSSTISRDCIT